MGHNQKARFRFRHTRRDFTCTLQEEIGNQWVIPDWLAIFPDLPVRARGHSTVQLQLAWNHRLREITFADEVWHDVNFPNRFWINKKKLGEQQTVSLFFTKKTKTKKK